MQPAPLGFRVYEPWPLQVISVSRVRDGEDSLL